MVSQAADRGQLTVDWVNLNYKKSTPKQIII